MKTKFINYFDKLDAKEFLQGAFLLLAFFTLNFVTYIGTFNLDILRAIDSTSILRHTFALTTYYLLSHVFVSLIFALFQAGRVPPPLFIAPIDPKKRSIPQKISIGIWNLTYIFFKYIINDITKIFFTISIFLMAYVPSYALEIVIIILVYVLSICFYTMAFKQITTTAKNAVLCLEDPTFKDHLAAINEEIKGISLGKLIKNSGLLLLILSATIGMAKAKITQDNWDLIIKDLGTVAIVTSTTSGLVVFKKDHDNIMYYLSWDDLSRSTFETKPYGFKQIIVAIESLSDHIDTVID